MKRIRSICACVLMLVIGINSFAVEMGVPVKVAPNAEETRMQTLANTVWSDGAGCWLVVWREGYLCDDASDIWCARISADGKALDPIAIRLSSGLGLKSRPVVASDGKDFLVVWEDFRNGKDWDVYARRVSGKGKVLDEDVFLIAGGAHNQCRPAVGFAKGNYFIIWMGYDRSYGIYGARVSSEGKCLDSKPLSLATRTDANQHVITPVLASNGDVLLAAMAPTFRHKGRSYVALSPVDVTNGELLLPPEPVTSGVRSRISSLHGAAPRSPVIAVGKTESIVAINAVGNIFRADLSGKITSETNIANLFCDRQALAFDGEKYLLVADGVEERMHNRYAQIKPVGQIRGWYVTPEGKPGKRFIVSNDTPSLQCVAPAAAAGSKGNVLVVYSVVYGNDDTKLVARIIK